MEVVVREEGRAVVERGCLEVVVREEGWKLVATRGVERGGEG